MDTEIQAMSKVVEALSGLEEPVRERVLRWAVARYASSGASIGDDELEPQGGEVDIAAFDDFSELFDAVGPSTEFEKVLVASYWFQEIEGHSSVAALTVNKALKQLGHGVGNVTREFNRLQAEKPSLVLQVKKKGSTKQARKQYKVTAAGKRKVGGMLSVMGE
jgi:hypothetical protein